MENEGLVALERLVYAITHDVNAYSQYTQSQPFIDKDKALVEKSLKQRENLVSMCENLAKLVGLKEKDYVELETLITKKLKALEIISKRFGSFILTVIEDDLRTSKEERNLLKEVLK